MTCSACQFFRLRHGEPRGECFGQPPRTNAGGDTAQNPVVKANRVACSLFKPLPEGQATIEHHKAMPETPGQAARAKRQERVDKIR